MEQRQLTHEVYSCLLDNLTTSKRLKAHFAERGEKKTFDCKDCENIHKAVAATIEKHGDACIGIAGFYRVDKKISWAYPIADAFLIPMRDADGLIHSLKIRILGENKNRYMYVDSAKKNSGTAMRGVVHFPKRIEPKQAVTVLRITEGEIKANVCAEHDPKTVTISMGGIVFFKQLPDVLQPLSLEPLQVKIAFDVDVYRRNSLLYGGVNAYNMLLQTYIVLRRTYPKAEMLLEKWDEQYGKGIDDVILAGHADKIKLEAGEILEKEISARIGITDGGKWVYVSQAQAFFRTDNSGVSFDKTQFSDSFLREKVTVAKVIKEQLVPVFDMAEYHPTMPPTYEENSMKVFNLFRGLPNIVSNTGDAGLFVEHIKMVSPEYQNIILDFLAYNVQHVGKKMKWALVIQGKEGIGKSFIGEVMKRMIGENNVATPNNENLKEHFNLWARACAFCIIEEFMTFGRQDLMNKLKPMITDNYIMIRTMRVDGYRVPNRFNIMGFTNYRNALRLDKHDRRYCVIYSDMKPQAKEYYRDLHAMLTDEQKIGALFHYLKSRDLKKFQPYGHAPATDAKLSTIEASMTQEAMMLREMVENESFPDIICVSDLTEYVNTKHRFMSVGKILQTMVEVDMYHFPNPIRVNGEQKRFWAIRNVHKYRNDPQAANDYIRTVYKDKSFTLNSIILENERKGA